MSVQGSAFDVERSPPKGAVFLSYASQDADAARRIAEALRAAGVEVWFDQSELRGGDSWDAAIRKQIKECALFVPVISENTQARTEGYFRLEWRLAEQRTHLMAKGRPFLLPVVIDSTRDADAHVPDSFTEVQWTCLRPAVRDYGGQALDDARVAALCARVARLLAGQGAAPASERPAQPRDERPVARKFNPVWLFLLIPGAILLIATGGMMIKRYKDAGSAGSASQSTAPVSETQDLVTKARALLDDDPLMTRANVELAEQLSLQAIAKDPTDGEAYAVAAWTNFRFIEANYEDTVQRRADLRRYAEKARLLAPDSINAELAITGVLLATDNRAEATLRLRALADRAPDNLTVLRAYAGAAPWGNGINFGDEEKSDPAALARLRAHSTLGQAYADSFLVNQHWTKAEYVEADRGLDAIFAAGQPVRLSYLLRLLVLTYGWGDMPAARDYIANLPAKLLLEDVFIKHVTMVFLYSGEHDRALATLDRTQREMLQEAKIKIPTGLLRGDVLASAGRLAAAAIQWRSALAVVDKLLGESPGDVMNRLHEAGLLSRLGDREGAAAEFGIAMEFSHPPAGSIPWGRGFDHFARIGDFENAIPRIERLVARDNGRWPNDYNDLRYDPSYALFRNDSRVQAIMARGAQWLEEMKAGAKAPVPAAASAAVPAPVDAKSVAVLAFANLSDDQGNEYFSDGISEELLNVLAKVPGLTVKGRSSGFFFKGKDTPVPEIAQQLGVTYVVQGSVRKAGNRVRISAQLIRAASDEVVWSSGSLDRELQDIFAVQDEIAGLVAQQLQLKLGVSKPAGVVNPEAHRLLLEARHYWHQRGEQNFDRTEALLRRALAIDADFAPAHAAMADLWVMRAAYRVTEGAGDLSEELRSLRTSAARATELDPSLVAPIAAMAYGLLIEGRMEAARQQFEAAVARSPKDPTVRFWRALFLMENGDFDAAYQEFARARELDPKAWIIAELSGQNALQLGRREEALALFRQANADRPDGFAPAVGYESLVLWQSGRIDEAVAAARAIRQSWPRQPRWQADAHAIWVLRQAGLTTEAAAYADALFAGLPAQTYQRGFVLAALGRFDEALPYLERTTTLSLDAVASLVIFDPWRDDPRFTALIEKLHWTEQYARAREAMKQAAATAKR